VTGASSGLGRATAILLSRLGARVFLIGRNEARLQEAIGLLKGSGHEYLSFDLNEADKIADLVTDLAKRFSPFSGVVHSAGIVQIKPLRVCRTQDFESLFRTNVVAGAQLLRGLTKRGAVATGGCSFVFISSALGIVGAPGMHAYCTSKAAILGLVRSAALELVKDRIRVNAVLPGYCETIMTSIEQQIRTPEQLHRTLDAHPMGIGQPDDVANAVAFLVADTARWITGTHIVVDGGFSAD
ncbi:MAG: SDR family oxidoreductase, partial [Planctomycetota bacterium]